MMNSVNGIRTTTYIPQPKEAAAIKQYQPIESERTEQSGSKDEQDAVLSKNEQNFFEQLYPDSAQEIRSYQTYRRDGERIMATMGSIVDRKG